MAVHDLKARLANHPKIVGALFALLLLTSQFGTVVACCSEGG
jgi:hypothetical protein